MVNKTWVDEAALAQLYPQHIETLQSRHDAALKRAGAAHVVVFSGAPIGVFLDDYDYPFKPNPHFVSWLPLTDNPFCYIVYTPGHRPKLIYYQPRDYWHVVPSDPDSFWTAYFDIDTVHSLDDVAARLPGDRDKCVLIGNVTDKAQAFGIDRINPGTVIKLLHFKRGVKTEYELECMRAASRKAVIGHLAAEQAFRSSQSEFAIHLEYCRAIGQSENELPYGNIIALNEHGAVLHYQHQSKEKPDGHLSFLIDAGAKFNGYASDITRTYAMENDEFASLLKRFEALQLELVGEVRAGVDFVDLHISCHQKIAQLLDEVGLARGNPDTLMETGVTAAFFPHGLGHLLGVQVHDVGGHMGDDTGTVIEPPVEHPYLRMTRPLEVNHVMTIEPGIYVIDMLIANLEGTTGYDLIDQQMLDWLRPYGGIRIEDNVRVLDDGCENLTRDAFAA